MSNNHQDQIDSKKLDSNKVFGDWFEAGSDSDFEDSKKKYRDV